LGHKGFPVLEWGKRKKKNSEIKLEFYLENISKNQKKFPAFFGEKKIENFKK
jgi:hypothetical protein